MLDTVASVTKLLEIFYDCRVFNFLQQVKSRYAKALSFKSFLFRFFHLRSNEMNKCCSF